MKKYSFPPFITFICIVSLAAYHSCKDSTTGINGDSNNFLFRVIVKNSGGEPVQNLGVSAYNKPFNFTMPKYRSGNTINKTASSSTIRFDIAKSSRVTLSLFELNREKVQEPITDELLQAGAYAVQLNLVKPTAGTRVYCIVLAAIDDTTKANLFRDSIYITLWQPDASLSVLGYTSSSGIVETADSLKFPHLLTLPLMIHTSETGDSLGILTLPEDVVITVSDTASHRSQMFVRKVNPGKNEFELIWDPSSPSAAAHSFVQQFSMAKVDTVVEPVVVPRQFRLYQNYPNPFN